MGVWINSGTNKLVIRMKITYLKIKKVYLPIGYYFWTDVLSGS